MTDLGTCAGERRSCSAPAVVVRQGRPLCAACADRRRAARSQRKDRARTAEAERAHAAGQLCAQAERGVGCRRCAPTWWCVAYPPPDYSPAWLARPLRRVSERLIAADGSGSPVTPDELRASGWWPSRAEAAGEAEQRTRAELARLEARLAALRILRETPAPRRPR